MKIYRYWASADAPVLDPSIDWKIKCYGGSNDSLSAALAEANRRAEQASRTFSSTGKFDHYAYGDRPLREEILNELQDGGRHVAVLTRNYQGCVVLNSPSVFIADMDLPPRLGKSVIESIAGWFGVKSESPEDKIVARVREIADSESRSIRLYRTANGFRAIVTDRVFDPESSESFRLLEKLKSDPLYVRLCKTQGCYRARLTPKPYRINCRNMSVIFPYETPSEEDRKNKWIAEYQQKATGKAACAFVGEFGSTFVDPQVDAVLRLHDEMSCGDGPLA